MNFLLIAAYKTALQKNKPNMFRMKFCRLRTVLSSRYFSNARKDPPGTNLVIAKQTTKNLEIANFAVEDLKRFGFKPRLTASLSVENFEALCTISSIYKIEATNQEGKICAINREGPVWSGYVRPLNEGQSYNRFIQTMAWVIF